MSVLLAGALLPPLVWAAVSDLRCRLIPDAAVLAVALLAVPRALWGGMGTPAFAEAFLVFCGGALLFRFGLMGGGDVKLLAACALHFPGGTLSFLVLVSLAGALLAVCYALPGAWRRRAGREDPRAGKGIPYGVAVAAGAALELGNTAGWMPARLRLPVNPL
jgi:prepilin peptidase CpaA